jgi:Flp pilus assembly secretin CpaC
MLAFVLFHPAFGRPRRVLMAGLAAFMLPIACARADDRILVDLDQAKVLQLPDKTATVVVGNPAIADVTFLKRSGSLILTGKSYGQTNLIALDAGGKAIGETQVRVAAGPGALIVQLGNKRVSYSCSPRCQPTLALGDDTSFTSEINSQVQQRNQLALPPR